MHSFVQESWTWQCWETKYFEYIFHLYAWFCAKEFGCSFAFHWPIPFPLFDGGAWYICSELLSAISISNFPRMNIFSMFQIAKLSPKAKMKCMPLLFQDRHSKISFESRCLLNTFRWYWILAGSFCGYCYPSTGYDEYWQQQWVLGVVVLLIFAWMDILNSIWYS